MIYITGDKHGSPDAYRELIESHEFTSEDYIIVCGDAGLEYGDRIMGSCKKIMSKCPATWVIFRGNHDARYWDRHARDLKNWTMDVRFGDGGGFQNKYPNIYYLSDSGGIYTIGGYNFLVIPGAYSVDKDYRLACGLPYEYNEQLTINERHRIQRLVYPMIDQIDFVCAHTFPYSQISNLKYLFLDCVDQSAVDKTMECFIEDLMIDIEKAPNFKHYFGGHYHDNKQIDKKYTVLYDAVVKVDDYIGN